jgi:hypothetical protein
VTVTSRSLFWPVVLTASAVCVALLLVLGVEGPVWVAVASGFLLVCPGMALVRPFRLAEQGTELVLAIAVSLGLEAIVASCMLYAGWWSPRVLLGVLVGLCALSGVTELATAGSGRAFRQGTVGVGSGTGGGR